MPSTRALLRDQGTEFMCHVADVAACAPGRGSLYTALYSHNHQIGAANSNDDYWNFWRDPAGSAVPVGRTDNVAGTINATVGPHELIVAGREALSGNLFNWLKRAGVTTANIGKLQNQSHNGDFRGGNFPTLAAAQAEQRRTPPDIDFYAGSAGAVSVDASNSPAAFYQAAGDVTASVTWNASDGSCTIKVKTAVDAQTIPKVGDILVVQGTGTLFDQCYDVGDASDQANHGTTTNSQTTFVAYPRSSTGLAALGHTANGNITCWSFTGGQHAPRHAILCVKKTPGAIGAAGVGTLRFHDVDSGSTTNDGTDPLHARPDYETDALADLAVEFISTRGPQEPWYLHLCPQVPHLGWDPFEVSNAYRFNISPTCTNGSNVITLPLGTLSSSHIGYQVNGDPGGATNTKIPYGALISALGTSGGNQTVTLVNPDGSACNCTGSGTTTVELHAVPFTGFAGWHNVAAQVAPTLGDQAVTSITISGGTITVTCPSHGFSSGWPVFLTQCGHGVDGYYPRETRIDGNTFTVPNTYGAANGTFTVTGQCIGRDNLRDWQGRQEKLINVDTMFQRVIAILQQRGWLDQCVILYTGDNGQQQGEHSVDENNQVWGNSKTFLWQASARTGLLARVPGWPAGRKILRPTWHADIPLGILDWFGLDDATCTKLLGFNPHVDRDGVSLKRLVENPASSYPGRGIYLSGQFLTVASSDGMINGDGQKVMITQGGATTRRYNLMVDEGETTNLHTGSSDPLSGTSGTLTTRMTTLSTRRGNAARTT